LLELNAQRAREEQLAGAAPTGAKGGGKSGDPKASKGMKRKSGGGTPLLD
jgi:hypothetical protein